MDKVALNKLALYLHFLADEICNNLEQPSMHNMAENIMARIDMLNPVFIKDVNAGIEILTAAIGALD
jgi:hypothetical protein